MFPDSEIKYQTSLFGLQVRCRDLDIFKILRFFWKFFRIFFLNIWGIFMEVFFRRIFWEDFWEEFFVYIGIDLQGTSWQSVQSNLALVRT